MRSTRARFARRDNAALTVQRMNQPRGNAAGIAAAVTLRGLLDIVAQGFDGVADVEVVAAGPAQIGWLAYH